MGVAFAFYVKKENLFSDYFTKPKKSSGYDT